MVLENYKSIAFCDVKLGPLTILVGPNGVGKSNFLDALRFLSEAMYAPPGNSVRTRGGFSRLRWSNASSDARLGFRVDLSMGVSKGYFSFRLQPDSTSGFTFERERCTIEPGPPSTSTNYNSARPSTHLQLVKDPDFAPLSAFMSNCRFYAFGSDSLRHPTSTNIEAVLTNDGANLPNVMAYMFERHRSLYDRINQYLRVINPSVEVVTVQDVSAYRALAFRMKDSAHDFNAVQMSEGTLRSLAVLVALFQRQAGAQVDLVGLEEPEAALHPAAAGVLFDAMREASSGVQVVATTHSADLLDNKDIDSEAILAVELEGGVTRIGRIDQTGRQALKKRMYTAGELMRMNYLRPEPYQPPNDSAIESVLFGDPVPA
ncbi:MAG: AAA family ATPase [Acidobacteriia bacterium]|nr:AAA family ATPase [Terriglobia bacterium]